MRSGKQTKVTTSHWGAFEVETEGDRITNTAPYKLDPYPSDISNILPQAIHHRTRVQKPAIRRSWLQGDSQSRHPERRGQDDFVEVEWDEAIGMVANELSRVIEEHGNRSIFGGSYGWASAGRFHHALSQVHRFLNCAGGYVSSFGSYSTAAAQAIIPHVFGINFLKLMWAHQNNWPMIADNTQTMVMFGGINPKNSQVSMGGVTHHETGDWFKVFNEKNIRRVNISPQRTDTPDGAEWFDIIPGTDTAMMLGLAYVLETEDLANRDFLQRCTTGYDRFKSYLLGEMDNQPKSPAWAAAICGIDGLSIENLARSMANSRTLITVSWSLQRAEFGEQPFWMAATLAAMVGQIGLPGGGIGYGYGAIGGIGVSVKRMDGLTFPQGKNPVTDFIPVARVADMLLNPGQSFAFNGQSLTYPDIKLVYWCGGNPFHHHQDLNRLEQAWSKPETIIVHEPWWTATAKRADIVLPATTPYEREDIGRAQGDSYLFHMPRMISPVGEARDDYQIFTDISERMGFKSEFTEGRTADSWLRTMFEGFRNTEKAKGLDVPDFDTLKKMNYVDLPVRGAQFSDVPFENFRLDPAQFPLATPSGKIEIFSETVADFKYEDCMGHATWQPPQEWLGSERAGEFPLHLVSPQPGDKLHSQMESAIADIPGQRPVPISMHSEDAQARGFTHKQIVKVFNQRGACHARVHITNDIRKNVVAIPTGAWYDIDASGVDKHGNPNILTRDVGTSQLGQGSSAHSTLVEVVGL